MAIALGLSEEEETTLRAELLMEVKTGSGKIIKEKNTTESSMQLYA